MVDALTETLDDGSSFEEIYERLEAAVSRLEEGGLSLEESIALYETGMRLAQRCKALLDAAALRVSELDLEFAPDEDDAGGDDDAECGEEE
jgi:exodeoxyribonuclease VII small subunit